MPCISCAGGHCAWYNNVMSGHRAHSDFPYLAANGRCLRNTTFTSLQSRGIDPENDECAEYQYVPSVEGQHTIDPSFVINCFDNGGQTSHRYTVHIFNLEEVDRKTPREILLHLGKSQNTYQDTGKKPGDYLGNPIAYDNLPEYCKKEVLSYIKQGKTENGEQ